MQLLQEGERAPSFKLKNQDGSEISLKEFAGKATVVLYFYPKAMTPGCTVQACGVRDSKAQLKKLGVVVLGVSPDTPERLKKFEEKEELNFTLLSDEDHQVCSAYGVWGQKKMMGRTYDGVHRVTY